MPKNPPSDPTVVWRPRRRNRRSTAPKPEVHRSRPSDIDAELRRRIEENKQRGSPHGR